MKVIFLDFDGVLNNSKTYSEGPWHNRLPVEPSCMEVLNRIIEQTGAKVVVSSSWRIFAKHSRTMLQELLTNEGFKGTVIGCTPPNFKLDGNHWSRRGDEIKAWLDAQREKHDFVVLDDDSDMDAVKDRFIQTDFSEGLQERHLDMVLNLFS